MPNAYAYAEARRQTCLDALHLGTRLELLTQNADNELAIITLAATRTRRKHSYQ